MDRKYSSILYQVYVYDFWTIEPYIQIYVTSDTFSPLLLKHRSNYLKITTVIHAKQSNAIKYKCSELAY